MRSIALVLLSIAVLAGIFFGWRSLDTVEYQRRQTAVRIEAQRQQLALERERFELQQAQQQATAVAPVQTLSTWLYTILPLVVACIAIYIAADAYRQRRTPLIRPDNRGQLPVARMAIEQGQLVDAMVVALAAYHRQQELLVTHQAQPVPHTFSPHVTVTHTPAVTAQPALPSVPSSDTGDMALPEGRVDLATCLTSWQPSRDSILLAVGPGDTAYYAHAKDLCHVALAGATGGGKSNIMRLLLAQLQAIGAKVVLADPHFTPYDPESGDDWRPIMDKLHMQPAVSATAIRHMLEWLATDELPQRLERRRNGEHPGGPLFLAIDELPSIVAGVKDAPDHLSRLLREGRKVGLLTIGAAQDFLVKTIGGSGGVRDCYRTAYYVGGDAQTARVLLDVKGSVGDGTLGQGRAMLRSKATPTAQLVKVPYASNEALYRLLGGRPQATPNLHVVDLGKPDDTPTGSQAVANAVSQNSALESDKLASVEAVRVAALFLAGKSPADIVAEVRGVKSNEGKRYQTALAEILDLLREGVRQAA